MSAVVAAPPSPYKGLAPYEDSDLDALLFFGRERESEVIAANLMAARLTILYGPSGVGKSSLLRAGVTSRLRSLVPAGGGEEGGEDEGSAGLTSDTGAVRDPGAKLELANLAKRRFCPRAAAAG